MFIWIIAALKVLAILAAYGGLAWTLERRSERPAANEGYRQNELSSRNKARRNHGRVA